MNISMIKTYRSSLINKRENVRQFILDIVEPCARKIVGAAAIELVGLVVGLGMVLAAYSFFAQIDGKASFVISWLSVSVLVLMPALVIGKALREFVCGGRYGR